VVHVQAPELAGRLSEGVIRDRVTVSSEFALSEVEFVFLGLGEEGAIGPSPRFRLAIQPFDRDAIGAEVEVSP
jgi:hypothetical protein